MTFMKTVISAMTMISASQKGAPAAASKTALADLKDGAQSFLKDRSAVRMATVRATHVTLNGFNDFKDSQDLVGSQSSP